MTKADLIKILEPFTDDLDIQCNLHYSDNAPFYCYIKIDIWKGSALVFSDRKLESPGYIEVLVET